MLIQSRAGCVGALAVLPMEFGGAAQVHARAGVAGAAGAGSSPTNRGLPPRQRGLSSHQPRALPPQRPRLAVAHTGTSDASTGIPVYRYRHTGLPVTQTLEGSF